MDLSAQLPFLLQAVPTASLVFPPLGTARRYLQLQKTKMVKIWYSKRKSRVFSKDIAKYLLLAKADLLDVGEEGVHSLALLAFNIHEE